MSKITEVVNRLSKDLQGMKNTLSTRQDDYVNIMIQILNIDSKYKKKLRDNLGIRD